MHEELRTATYDQELIADYYYNLFDELKDSLKTKTIGRSLSEQRMIISLYYLIWLFDFNRC